MSDKVKVRIIKKKGELKELKDNIKIKEINQEPEEKKTEEETKKDVISVRQDFIQEERAESKPTTPSIAVENIRPVRNLDEVTQISSREENRNEVEPRTMYEAGSAVTYETVLPQNRQGEERSVYNPERTEAARIVEPRTPEFGRENIIKPLRRTTAPAEVMEERRDMRLRTRNEFTGEHIYKEYERKYEEKEPDKVKERRRKLI